MIDNYLEYLLINEKEVTPSTVSGTTSLCTRCIIELYNVSNILYVYIGYIFLDYNLNSLINGFFFFIFFHDCLDIGWFSAN